MSYIVFARKYRPQAFDEVVGQAHITTTLTNAISQNRVAHAYLFSGPRGIGKTTTARILAKALNCEMGPTVSPCNKCAACLEITQGASLDVLEIDGASNRGIDEIRNLRDNIKFSPAKGKFKIYIIDEVHMLTQEAFNALLKTLEEPPAHVKFIFATTQAHKVPSTILSRCQRFDFRRIATKDIRQSLKKIAENEKLEVKDEVLNLIAKHADGSMRDAEVILDQISSFTKGKVDALDVVRVLGIVDEEVLFVLSGAVRQKDALSALKMIDTLSNDGKDMVQVVTGLIGHFRNISVIKISKELSSLIDASSETIKRYENEASHFSLEELIYIIHTLSNTVDLIKRSGSTKIPFESAMVKLTRMATIVPIEEILSRLDELRAGFRANGEIRLSGHKEIPAPAAPDVPLKKDETVPAADPAAKVSGIEEIASSWKMIVNDIKTKKMSVAMYLQAGYPTAIKADTLMIGFPREHNFYKEALESQDCKPLIEEAIKTVLNRPLYVKFIVDENIKSESIQDVAGDAPEKKNKNVEPIIKDAIAMFNGQLRRGQKDAAE